MKPHNMPKPYFKNSTWSPFIYDGNSYNLSHLDEYEFSIVDTTKTKRLIGVTFSDHCFTRKPTSDDNQALAFRGSTRKPGLFCFKRYELSFGLIGHITNATNGCVWIVDGDNFAVLPIRDTEGQTSYYGIMFSLDRVSGLPIDLHMRVKTAYLLDKKSLVEYGKVRFKMLVTLRMARKMPKRQRGHKRK
jgi:hypothetical protein